MHLSRRGWLVLAVVWLVLMGAALCADAAVADAVHRAGWPQWLNAPAVLPFTRIWKFPGTFGFTVVVAVAALVTGWMNWRQCLFLLLAGVLAGMNVFTKWMVGRTRPFKLDHELLAEPFVLHPFRGGLSGFFHQENLSFCSGHECSAFALAVAVACLFPRVSVLFFAVAAAVGVERVLENAHYCSDVVAALPLATLGTFISFSLLKPRSGACGAEYNASP